MKYILKVFFICYMFTLPTFAISQIKVICDRDGEVVYLNNKFKSECSNNEPIALLVKSGKYKIEVIKSDKNGKYQFFKSVRIGDGVSKVIEAKTTPVYSEYHYFKEAQKSENLSDVQEYKRRYPKGKYLKDINELEFYINAKNDFKLFNNYFKKYPHGHYKEKLMKYYDDNPLVATLKAHKTWVYDIALSKDGKTLYSVGSLHGLLNVWDLKSFTLKKSYHVNDRNGLDYIALSPSGEKAITGATKIRVWDLKSGNYKTLKFYGMRIVYIDNDHIAGVNGVSFKIVDIHNQQVVYKFSPNDGYDAYIESLIVTKDKKFIYFSYWNTHDKMDEIAKFDLAKNKIVKSLYSNDLKDTINAFAITNDGKYLISGMKDCSNSSKYNETDKTIIIWDTTTYKPIKVLKQSDGVNAVSLDKKNEKFATGGWGGIIKIWDMKTKTLLHKISTFSPIFDLQFSNDGKLLMAALKNGTIKVFYTGGYSLKKSLKKLSQRCQDGDLSACAIYLNNSNKNLMKTKKAILKKVSNLTHKTFHNPKIYLLSKPAFSIFEVKNKGGIKEKLELLIKDEGRVYAPISMHCDNARFRFNSPIALIQNGTQEVYKKRYPSDYIAGTPKGQKGTKDVDVVLVFDDNYLSKGEIKIYESPKKKSCPSCLRLDGFIDKVF